MTDVSYSRQDFSRAGWVSLVASRQKLDLADHLDARLYFHRIGMALFIGHIASIGWTGAGKSR